MMQRPFLLITLFTLTGLISYAQPSKVVSAYQNYREDRLELADADIRAAMEHHKTKEWSKTWYYHGLIEKAFYDRSVGQDAEEYEYLLSASRAFMKAESYTMKRPDGNRILRDLKLINGTCLLTGVSFYNEKSYKEAVTLFRTAYETGETCGFTDSLSLYNIGLCYDRQGRLSEANGIYRQCIAIDYKPQTCYQFIVYNLTSEGKVDEAQKVLSEALKKYPNNREFLTTQINIHLQNGMQTEALVLVERVLKYDHENKVLHFVSGAINESLGRTEEARKSYQTAIDLDPNYFDPTYNLAASYVNETILLTEQMNEIPTDQKEQYESLRSKKENLLKKALKLLEHAYKLKSDDHNTLQSLYMLYSQLGMTQKADAIKARLDRL